MRTCIAPHKNGVKRNPSMFIQHVSEPRSVGIPNRIPACDHVLGQPLNQLLHPFALGVVVAAVLPGFPDEPLPVLAWVPRHDAR